MKKQLKILTVACLISIFSGCDGSKNDSTSTSNINNTSDSVLSNETNSNSEQVSNSNTSSSETLDQTKNQELIEAFKKEYKNLTYSQVIDENYSAAVELNVTNARISETDIIEENKYQISYDSGSETFECYVENIENGVRVYSYGEDGKWYYRDLDMEKFTTSERYANYQNSFNSPNDFDLKPENFYYKDGSFYCKEEVLNTYGADFVDFGYQNTTYTSLKVTLDNGYVSQISVSYEAAIVVSNAPVEIDGIATFNYEYINDSFVVLPDATLYKVPSYDYINQDDAIALSATQKSDLTSALSAKVDSYGVEVTSIDYDGFTSANEVLLYEQGKYDFYDVFTTYYGLQTQSAQTYLEEVNENQYRYFYLNNDNKVSQTTITSEDSEYLPISTFYGDFNLDVNEFLIKDGIYVYSKNGLSALTTDFEIDGAVKSLELTLKDNYVSDLNIVFEFAETEELEAYQSKDTYHYFDINNTTVQLPVLNSEATINVNADLTAKFADLLAKKYDSYSVSDNILGSLFLYNGNHVDNLYINENEFYLASYDYVDGHYYGYDDNGSQVEIPSKTTADEYGFDYYTPYLDLTSIDVSKATYDTFNKEYIFNYDDLNFDSVLFYYFSLFDGVDFEVVKLKVDALGNLRGLTLTFTLEGEHYEDYGLTFFNYNHTNPLGL